MKRVFFDVLLVLCLFLVPWWAGFLLSVIGIFLFKNFYEFLLYGVFVYATYGFASDRLISGRLWLPAILLIIFFLIVKLKKIIIFYRQ